MKRILLITLMAVTFPIWIIPVGMWLACRMFYDEYQRRNE